jgi:xanthine dehydrogenase YagR molybdenum-binding subunit
MSETIQNLRAAPEPKANMGKAAPRIDGRRKVTGEALYASDFPLTDPAYAFLVTSPIAKGRVASFDLAGARAVPGILEILTHENMEPVEEVPSFGEGGPASTSVRPLQSPEIRHHGEIIALAVGESFEAAREAAQRVHARFVEEPPSAGFDSPGAEIQAIADFGHEDPSVGDAEVALAASEVTIDATYEMPAQHHNAMELFATTCVWQGDHLTVYEPSQWVYGLKNGLAQQLGIDPEKVHVISPFVGGAFGGKGALTPRTAMVAVAARRLGRPVKLVVGRDQGFTTATYRAETRHRVRLGAARDGRLSAYAHEAWELTSRADVYFNAGTDNTVRMYAAPNVSTRVHIVRADRNTPGFMRAPPETPYMYALESAMDELAARLGMDPVELRRVNDTMTDPITGARYTSRSLMQCYDEAARAFGWEKRNPAVGSMRDGDWLVGFGCATATFPTLMAPCRARVRLTQDGRVRVQVAAHDLGTGAYTVIGQAAAEKLGTPLERVEVELGDSDLPPGPVAGGSNTTASTCSTVGKACAAIREKLFRAAVTANEGPLAGRDWGELDLADGQVVTGDGSRAELAEVFSRLGGESLEEEAEWLPPGVPPEAGRELPKGKLQIVGGPTEERLMFAFGAEFVEVRIHARTREIRVPRMVGAFAAGRIMNPRTARSQYMGGMIWGLGSALHEETEIDRRTARYVNANIAEYLIPVNADIGSVEVILVPEVDTEINPAGAKGIGEIGIVDTAAAVASAVHHATGVRVRKLPIRVEDVLPEA